MSVDPAHLCIGAEEMGCCWIPPLHSIFELQIIMPGRLYYHIVIQSHLCHLSCAQVTEKVASCCSHSGPHQFVYYFSVLRYLHVHHLVLTECAPKSCVLRFAHVNHANLSIISGFSFLLSAERLNPEALWLCESGIFLIININD